MKLPSFPISNGQNTPEEGFNPFPDLSPTPTPKKLKNEHLIFSISLLIFLSSLGIYLTSKNNQSKLDLSSNSNQQAQAAPTPTPKPIPTGKQVYNYSHGKSVVGPKPTQAIIDPIDPKDGQKQILTLTIPHNLPITKASAILNTDNHQEQFDLSNISDDLWQTEWKMTDTYNYRYQIQFVFSDDTETFTGALTFR